MQRILRYALGLCIGVPTALGAQGFGVYEHGTCTMGRSGVAAASPCPDGSAIFFNPAGLGGLTGTHISAGVTLIAATGGFTDDATGLKWDLDNPIIPVPSFYLTHGFSSKFTAGIGVFAPYGLETRWPDAAAYDSVTGAVRPASETFPGRFLGWNSKLASIYIQPTIGYQIHPRVKLGIGVAYITSHVELRQRIDFSQQIVPSASVPPGTRFSALGIPTGSDFAEAHLDASGNGWAVNLGAIIKVSERFSIGGHYLTRATIDYDGTADFTQLATGLILPPGNPLNPGTPVPIDAIVAPNFAAGGPLADTKATTSITMPNQASIGFAWQARENWTLMADYQTVRWRWFDKLELDFENPAAPDITLPEDYRNTHAVRIGTEWAYSPKLTLRGGYLYHTAAAPPQTVTPLLPEGARNEFTLGFGWRVTEKLQADVGYQYIRQDDRRGRVNDETVGNTGLYTFKANLFGFGLAYTF